MSSRTLTPPASGPATLRPHKRVQWRAPRGPKKPPQVIGATTAELVRALEQRRGSIWTRIKDLVPIAGYARSCARERVRSFRSDGAASLLAMVVALLHLSDIRSGFVGKPRPYIGGRWQRYKLRDLAQLAYQGQSDADLRRAARALSCMVDLGWASPAKQVRQYTEDGTFRSEPAIRMLNFNRICRMAGTTWLLQRDRKHADQKHGTGTASMEEARAAKQQRDERRQKRQENLARLETELWTAGAGNRVSGPPRPTGRGGGLTLIRNLFESDD